MKEDIIVEVAKRTIVEIKDQVLDTPRLVMPFAVFGVFTAFATITVMAVIATVAVVAVEAHYHYKEVLREIEDGTESTDPEEDAVLNESAQKEQPETK